MILLLADGTSAFLPTIMSRCVTLPLRPVPEKAVEDCLKERFGADEYRARLCARFSGAASAALPFSWKTKTLPYCVKRR